MTKPLVFVVRATQPGTTQGRKVDEADDRKSGAVEILWKAGR